MIITSAGGLFDLTSFDALSIETGLTLTADTGQTVSFNAGDVGTKIVSFLGITSLTLSNPNLNANDSNNLDNFVFNDVGTAAVPEPAMLGLFGLGALALAGARRRRA